MRPRESNDRLRMLISETGWTYERTARAVAAVAAETGIRVRCDRSAVAHWLAGTRPRPAAAACLLEALSRGLGRRIGPGQAGLSVAGSGSGELGESDPLGQLSRLLDAAVGKTIPGLEVYSPAGVIVPGWSGRTGRRPVCPDAAHVPEAISALRFFADLDAARGGGHARPVLMSYLAVELADRSPRLGDALVPLVVLAGFTCFDEHQHALAQRLYQVAAALAVQAGDLDGYVIAARGLAGQAHALGHHDVALWLIGDVLALDERTAARFAGLHAYAACAYAAIGEFGAALSSLRDTGVALDAAARLAPPPFGGYDHAGLAKATGLVLAAQRDLPAAVGALRVSLRCRPARSRRTRTLTMARLADYELRRGRLRTAVDTWRQVAESSQRLRSARVQTAIGDASARLLPHRRDPAVRSLLASIRDGQAVLRTSRANDLSAVATANHTARSLT